MTKKISALSPHLSFSLVGLLFLMAPSSAQVRFVIADVHNCRYSRPVDGSLGMWSYAGRPSRESAHSGQWVAHNGDLIDGSGRPDIASVLTPRVGITSVRDPDAIEYKILCARVAGIDAFNLELARGIAGLSVEPFRKVAAKYHFPIMCPYSWVKPQGGGSDNADAVAQGIRYFESELSRPDWPKFEGRPLALIWQTPREVWGPILEGLAGKSGPVFAWRWFLLTGKQKLDGSIAYQDLENYRRDFESGLSIQPWVPPRVRPGEGEKAPWDSWASGDDAVAYLKHLREGMERQPGLHPLPMASVTTGFDNRGCAGWGRKLELVEDDGGKTFEKMWQTVYENRDFFKAVYIATWDDYTEGSVLEPTVERGYRDLHTAREWIGRCKGVAPASPKLLEMPERLFWLRKAMGRIPNGPDKEGLSNEIESAAEAIGQLHQDPASAMLESAEKKIAILRKSLGETRVIVVARQEPPGETNAFFNLPLEVRRQLAGQRYEAELTFEYFDGAEGSRWALKGSSPRRADPGTGDFSVIADVRGAGTGLWKKGRVALYGENIDFRAPLPNGSDFEVQGSSGVRDLRLSVRLPVTK